MDEQGRFVADYIDYAIVYQLLEESFAESLGDVKRYTDDRIRMIEKDGMMTPRDLAEKTSVSTAAISQWSKPLIEKGVLTWCDETGAVFGDDLALEKAKRSGKAFICVAGGKSLPSPFQLTGDPCWDMGGDLYAAYDLQFDDGGNDGDQAWIRNDSEVDAGNVAIDDGSRHEEGTPAVKLFREKTNDDIKKMMETFRKNHEKRDLEGSIGEQLFHEFSDILSTEGVGAVN